jgi:hypothetical protein
MRIIKGEKMKKVYLSVLILAVCTGMASLAGATAVQWVENGHWYEKIEGSLSWGDASAQAQSMGGYLVTITSAEENLFLTNNSDLGNFDNGGDLLDGYWTGGYQPSGSIEPGGGWAWVTGEAFSYSHWYWGGEPNNSDGEDFMVFAHEIDIINHDGKAWNDTKDNTARGYVVEYNPVPEPTTFLLLGFGFLGVAGISRRKN